MNNQLSRRRFMISTASVGIVAGTIGASCNEKAAESWVEIESWTENPKCRNMMRLFSDVTFNEIFFSTTVWDTLGGNLSRLSAEDRVSIEPFILAAKDSGMTIFDLFATNRDEWPLEVRETCETAATKATMPFYLIPDGEARFYAAIFLEGTGGAGTTFLDAFGTQTFYQVYTKPIDTCRDETLWELHLLRRAKELGILRTQRGIYPPLDSASKDIFKGHCACSVNSEWQCVASSDPDDLCGIEMGQLQAGSDYCLLPCP